MKEERCKKCGLSNYEVTCTENFFLNDEELCWTCCCEKYGIILDYRSDLKRYEDSLAEGE